MNEPGETYKYEGDPPSYRHDYHAGNVGDVWKHIILLSLIGALRRRALTEGSKILVIDTHAGAGAYDLSGYGEWKEGVARLAGKELSSPSSKRYLDSLAELGFSREAPLYPGSPRLMWSLRQPGDEHRFFEIESETCARLRSSLPEMPGLEIRNEDGLMGAVEALSRAWQGLKLCVIDPPWVSKSDWTEMPAKIARLLDADPEAVIFLWYPIKSYTRVNAMFEKIGKLPRPGLICELLTSPLIEKKNRLNGSGVMLVNQPPELATQVGEAGAEIGPLLSRTGFWEMRLRSLVS